MCNRKVLACQGKKIMELGCGSGLAGLAYAACGGHVLLTDLPKCMVHLQHVSLVAACTASWHDLPCACAGANPAEHSREHGIDIGSRRACAVLSLHMGPVNLARPATSVAAGRPDHCGRCKMKLGAVEL